jgi:hypothetical protein
MESQPNLTYSVVSCPKGHKIKLEIRAATEERLRAIECPTCQTRTVIFSGDLVGVLSAA